MIGTCGFAFAMFGRFVLNRPADVGLRLLTAALSLFVLFYPSDNWAMAAAPFAAIATIIGIWRHRLIAAPPALDAVDRVCRHPSGFVRAGDGGQARGVRRHVQRGTGSPRETEPKMKRAALPSGPFASCLLAQRDYWRRAARLPKPIARASVTASRFWS